MKSRVQIESGNWKECVVRGLMKARVLNQTRNFDVVGSRNNCSTPGPFSDEGFSPAPVRADSDWVLGFARDNNRGGITRLGEKNSLSQAGGNIKREFYSQGSPELQGL
jgi:hypothetical protein